MTLRAFTVSPFIENCYVAWDDGEAALIDPGTTTAAERQPILDLLQAEGLRVRHLLLTHAHLDHVFGCAHFQALLGHEAEGGGWQLHPADTPLLANAHVQAELFGARVDAPPPPAHLLADGDTIQLGRAVWTVLHAPGHSPGSVCFYDAANGFVIAGDVLFAGSIGRTDLWEGDYDTLIHSIRTRLLTLPDETVVYPGHGPATTVGQERRTNPFLNE